jgi:hypothetical protein
MESLAKILGDWKSQLQKRSPPARTLKTRVGGLSLYSLRLQSVGIPRLLQKPEVV